MLSYLKSTVDLIYPVSCGGCGALGIAFCERCADSLRVVDPSSTCPSCGRWLGTRTICGECMERSHGFEEGYFGFYFENRMREAVHAFKFQDRKDVGKRLIGLMEDRITAFCNSFDCIIPIPVTEKRLRERGFNQSFIISEEISAITGKTLIHDALRKTRETRDQYTLSRKERAGNVRGVFALGNPRNIIGKRVLLVDDLFTTGHTAREAARILRKARVKKVIFFALARTP